LVVRRPSAPPRAPLPTSPARRGQRRAHDSLADVKVLLSIYLILCLSSVPCERGFSTMLIVKTRLRNCLDILTVDAHMQVSLNGPGMAQTDEINSIVEAAIDHFLAKTKCCPNRSNPENAGRPKKAASVVKLSDLLRAQARAAQDRDGEGLFDDEELDDREAASAEQELLFEDVDLVKQLQDSVGPYTIVDGYKVVPKPCETQADWTKMCKKRGFWTKKFVVHIAPDGWHQFTYRKKHAGPGYEPDEGWLFFCGVTKMEYVHQLSIGDYGLQRTWLIIEKEAAAAGEAEGYERPYKRRVNSARRSTL